MEQLRMHLDDGKGYAIDRDHINEYFLDRFDQRPTASQLFLAHRAANSYDVRADLALKHDQNNTQVFQYILNLLYEGKI